MKISPAEIQAVGDQTAVVACIANRFPNYTGVATVHQLSPGGQVQGNKAQLENACLFPLSMVQEAIKNGTLYLEGGDWLVCSLPPGIEDSSEYFSFRLELDG
jgi:hypothetical protein